MNIEPKNSIFSVIIRPNSGKNEVTGHSESLKAYTISIKAKPEHNKANIELIKFLSRILNKNVKIISGLSSRRKLIKIG